MVEKYINSKYRRDDMKDLTLSERVEKNLKLIRDGEVIIKQGEKIKLSDKEAKETEKEHNKNIQISSPDEALRMSKSPFKYSDRKF